MSQTRTVFGVTSLILGLFSLAITLIFILNFPGPMSDFQVEGFRQLYSGIPPTLPFVLVGSTAALFSYRSGFCKPAVYVSLLSCLALYGLFFY